MWPLQLRCGTRTLAPQDPSAETWLCRDLGDRFRPTAAKKAPHTFAWPTDHNGTIRRPPWRNFSRAVLMGHLQPQMDHLQYTRPFTHIRQSAQLRRMMHAAWPRCAMLFACTNSLHGSTHDADNTHDAIHVPTTIYMVNTWSAYRLCFNITTAMMDHLYDMARSMTSQIDMLRSATSHNLDAEKLILIEKTGRTRTRTRALKTDSLIKYPKTELPPRR